MFTRRLPLGEAPEFPQRQRGGLLRRLEQGSVPRDQFELVFRELAAQLTSLRVVAIPSMAPPLTLSEAEAKEGLGILIDALTAVNSEATR